MVLGGPMIHLILLLLCLYPYASLEAANGVNQIAISPASIALGGTGVGHFTTGSEALLKNPAILTQTPVAPDNFSADFFTTLRMQQHLENAGAGNQSNQGGLPILPEFSATYRLSEDLFLGGGLLSSAGAAMEFSGQAGTPAMRSALYQSRAVVAASYRISDSLSVGVAPFFALGQFHLRNNKLPETLWDAGLTRSQTFGGLAGIHIHPAKHVEFGLAYISRSRQRYPASVDFNAFGPQGQQGTTQDFQLDQPAEYAMGVTYHPTSEWTLVGDYRIIAWGGADGYRDLGWSDQHVVALGAQYAHRQWAFRGGLNYARPPVSSTTNENGDTLTSVQGTPIYMRNLSLINLTAFQLMSQTHLTAGAGFWLTNHVSLDAAIAFIPPSSLTRSGIFQGASYNFRSDLSQVFLTMGGTFYL